MPTSSKGKFFSKKMLIVLFLGFSSGLPLALTGGTLQAWLKKSGIDLPQIGYFALVGLPYALKLLWAPLLDGIKPFLLGRRRGWSILTQLGLVLAIAFLGWSDPVKSLPLCALAALLVAFLSASQDVVVDALKIEILDPDEYAIGASVGTLGYRLAMLVSGALALWLADDTAVNLPWHWVYLVMAGCMLPGIITVLLAPEPKVAAKPSKGLKEIFLEPFVEFFRRPAAIEILSFVMVYKLSTMMATSLTTAFLLELKYTLTEIGPVAKIPVMIASMSGPLVGAYFMTHIGLKRALWVFGIIQAFAGLSYLGIYYSEHSVGLMIGCLVVENFLIGLGVASISAFMMVVVNKQFTGTQFALLTSLAAVPRVVFVAPAGSLAQWLGWPQFFLMAILLAIPGLLLLTRYDSWIEAGKARSKIAGIDLMILWLFCLGLLLIISAPFWRLSPDTEFLFNEAPKAGAAAVGLALVIGFLKPRHKTSKV